MKKKLEDKIESTFQTIMGTGMRNANALIKDIRNCKTIADEKKVLLKESAMIRSSF